MDRQRVPVPWAGLELPGYPWPDREPYVFDAFPCAVDCFGATGESIIPVSFWYWSIGGSVIMCLYFIFKRDPVGILAYLPNSLIYIRNLMLIQKGKSAPTAAAPSQHPREMG